MLFLKQATILLLIVVSTRSFSQQLINEKFQSGNNESKISENTDFVFQNNKKSDNLLDSPLEETKDNSSMMVKEGDISDIHETAVQYFDWNIAGLLRVHILLCARRQLLLERSAGLRKLPRDA